MFTKNLGKLAKSCCLAAVVAALSATTAYADYRSYDRGERYRTDSRGRGDDRRDDRSRTSLGIRVARHSGSPAYCPPPPAPVVVEERVWVEPVYRTVAEQKWVPAVYRTVTERVYVPGEARTIPDRTWEPDRYEWRDVERRDRWGHRYISRERVLVEPAHFVDCPRTVEVTPGHYEDRTRQELVCEGHYETCERQELVSAGYWTTRPVVMAQPVVVAPRLPRYEESHARIDLRFPIGR